MYVWCARAALCACASEWVHTPVRAKRPDRQPTRNVLQITPQPPSNPILMQQPMRTAAATKESKLTSRTPDKYVRQLQSFYYTDPVRA